MDMVKLCFKILFRLALAAGAVFAAVALLQYLDDQQPDYIEIYNDDGLDGESF
jgi:hypothetical protein